MQTHPEFWLDKKVMKRSNVNFSQFYFVTCNGFIWKFRQCQGLVYVKPNNISQTNELNIQNEKKK